MRFLPSLIAAMKHPSALVSETGTLIAASKSFQHLFSVELKPALRASIGQIAAAAHKSEPEHYVFQGHQVHVTEILLTEGQTSYLMELTLSDMGGELPVNSAHSHLKSKLQLAIKVSGIGIWEFDPDTAQVYWDDRMLDIYGVQDGQNCRSDDLWGTHLHPDDRDATIAYSDECQRLGRDFNRDYRIVLPDGEIRTIRSIARFIETKGDGGRLIGVNIDVTEDYLRAEELETAKRQLEHDSRHDALTGLANRRALDEAMQELQSLPGNPASYAVLHLDLDHFKQINDTLGHAAGDAVLVHVADHLRGLVAPGDIICRVGGDEFVVLLPSGGEGAHLATLAQRIIDIAEIPFAFEGADCKFGVSVGIACSATVDLWNPNIFINADLALYAAKEAGRGMYRFFTPNLALSSQVKLDERQELMDAIQNEELQCYFQPQFDARTKTCIGAEALVRWCSETRGIVTAADFLPRVNEAGLSARVDEKVLDTVLDWQDLWLDMGLTIPVVSLNLSCQRLAEASFRDQLYKQIRPRHRLSFQLLETSDLDVLGKEVCRNIAAIRELGIGLELDDFGSGRASIVAMQNIAPDRVKIDRALSLPVTERPSQLLILQALSKIARLEGIEVAVQGLETDAHLATIANVDCDVLQGYALAYPLSPEDFEKFLHSADIAPRARRHSKGQA